MNINYSELKPLETISGFSVRPGFYEMNGASIIPGGINFTISSHGATSCELLLFKRKASEPYARIPFPEHYRIGNVFSMIVFHLEIDEFEYAYSFNGPFQPERGLLFNHEQLILDPYAGAVTGQSVWGAAQEAGMHYKARVVHNNFDWGTCCQPMIPVKDTIIYELHVRGFTRHPSSGVTHPGTFDGIREKIPYLKDLGITMVEMMPIFEFDEMNGSREINGSKLLDYWGYNPVSFFAPNTSYTAGIEYNREGTELKNLIRELHENKMEVVLDVVFNHTAEGDQNGPCFSFKGLDNNIYYMLTPDGHYYNFSGCGNTLNCNHPIVRQFILNCLRYWVINYRVDGFRFDLASILGRNEDATPMSNPPLLESLAYDPILWNVDLIAEAWDAGGLYQVGTFPSWNRWAEWNGKYRDDLRSFLKGDEGCSYEAAQRIMGSPDLYPPDKRGSKASVNFLTCHDGFTLYDLYSYNTKHNESNGWNNTDGADDNRSWNCGTEGPSGNPDIRKLRLRMIKNACAVLMTSRGTPMFFSGDEFCNTQNGNNNTYCQDNELSWLDWDMMAENKEIYEFFKFMIHFRKEHPCITESTSPCTEGYPYMSAYGLSYDDTAFATDHKAVSVLFAGQNYLGEDDMVLICVNAFWEPQSFELPPLPGERYFIPVVDTSRGTDAIISGQEVLDHSRYVLGPRSTAIFTICPIP